MSHPHPPRRAQGRGHATGAARPVVRTPADRAAFRARLLATLPGPYSTPVSTTALGDFFQLDPYGRSELLWASLDQMARDGLVERVVHLDERVRYWRRTKAGHEQVEGTDAAAEPR